MIHGICEKKEIVENSDGVSIAYEYICPTHGYWTDCYICNPDIFDGKTVPRLATGRCRKCRDK